MKAAVMHTAGQPPRFAEFPDPIPGEDELLVDVRAASLKRLDKTLASGAHYASQRELPFVCGVDGVGVLVDGSRVFFGGARPPYGTMAERSVAPRAWCFAVPQGVDDATAAALPNPALSAWLPLTWRAQLALGETVLILGATGVAGKLAVQIARHLGAGRVVAAGRNQQILESLHDLGADATIPLDQPDPELAEAYIRAAEPKGYDVILDYLWGRPTEVLLGALTRHSLTAEPARICLVQIGDVAGPTIALPAATLRSAGVEIYGSGGGSIPRTAIRDAFPQVMALAADGKLQIDTEQVALADIESAWQRQDLHGRRIVIMP